MTDRASPMGYVVFAACCSLFVWLYAIMSHLPVR
jgi:hypothetical protein